jgi:glycine/D-amino acid oxidase-like deaminating enzyme
MALGAEGFAVTQFEDGLRIVGTVEIAGLRTPPNEKRAEILLDQAKLMFPTLECDEPRLWMGFRPSTPDGLPILGPVSNRPGIHLAFGHGQYGLSGGPPSGRLVAELIAGAKPHVDPGPYRIGRFR